MDLPCLVDADALRVLLQALHDGPHEIGPSLMTVFLLILDCPSRRAALPPGIGIDVRNTESCTLSSRRALTLYVLQVVLAGFTEAYGHGAAHLDRLRGSYRNTSLLLKSWSGE
jgi:hypothetical protein